MKLGVDILLKPAIIVMMKRERVSEMTKKEFMETLWTSTGEMIVMPSGVVKRILSVRCKFGTDLEIMFKNEEISAEKLFDDLDGNLILAE